MLLDVPVADWREVLDPMVGRHLYWTAFYSAHSFIAVPHTSFIAVPHTYYHTGPPGAISDVRSHGRDLC
jgi:hypothetical protein